MSTTKLEVHLQQATCTGNMVKFGFVVPEICMQTDIQIHKQTDVFITVLHSLLEAE